MGFEGTSCLDEAWGRILPAEGTVLQTARSTLRALFSWADQPLWRVAGEGQVQTLRGLEWYSAERTWGTLLAGLQGLVSAGLERVSRLNMGFPGGTPGKDLACQQVSCKRHRFHPWVRNIPLRRPQQPTLVFLPGESHCQRSQTGYSPYGRRVKHDWSDLAAAATPAKTEQREKWRQAASHCCLY